MSHGTQCAQTMSPRQTAVQRYYASHSSEIIARKTLRHVRESGRRPRPSTMEAHNIDPALLQRELTAYAHAHPETRAARRILQQTVTWRTHSGNLA